MLRTVVSVKLYHKVSKRRKLGGGEREVMVWWGGGGGGGSLPWPDLRHCGCQTVQGAGSA